MQIAYTTENEMNYDVENWPLAKKKKEEEHRNKETMSTYKTDHRVSYNVKV